MNKIIQLILIIVFSFNIMATNYKILYLGEEPITSSQLGIGGQITSDKIKSASEIQEIGNITTNEKKEIKKIDIYNDKYKFLGENIKNSEKQIDIVKFKQYLKKRYLKYIEYLDFYGGVSYIMLVPIQYDEEKSEIENYIIYLQSSGYRIAVLDSIEYEKYLKLDDKNKIRKIQKKIFENVVVHVENE